MRQHLQLTLDLFEAPAPAPAPAPDCAAQPGPAQPLASVLEPLRFVHPRANRSAVLGEVLVGYEFKRARRRHIGFTVGVEGLTVSAPRWVPLYEVESALQNKAAWIVRKLAESREREQRRDAGRIAWGDDAAFNFLGEPVRVLLGARHALGEAVLHAEEGGARRLHVGLPPGATPEQVRDGVQAWLMRQARRIFTERLEHFAPQLGVRWSKLALSSASTRWGTARVDGAIRLNWRLIHFRLPVIDYVVAHELSHLRVMDHSPRFWDTVGTVVPDYAELRAQLRSEALAPW